MSTITALVNVYVCLFQSDQGDDDDEDDDDVLFAAAAKELDGKPLDVSLVLPCAIFVVAFCTLWCLVHVGLAHSTTLLFITFLHLLDSRTPLSKTFLAANLHRRPKPCRPTLQTQNHMPVLGKTPRRLLLQLIRLVPALTLAHQLRWKRQPYPVRRKRFAY